MHELFWKVTSLFWLVQRSLFISMKKLIALLEKFPPKVFHYQPNHNQVWKHKFHRKIKLVLLQYAWSILKSEFLVLNGAAKPVNFNEKILCDSEEITTKSISLQPQNSQVWKHGFINYWQIVLRLFQFACTVLNKKILN